MSWRNIGFYLVQYETRRKIDTALCHPDGRRNGEESGDNNNIKISII